MDPAAALPPASFKLLDVRARQPLRAVLQAHRLPFVRGRAFYQLHKRETVHDHKRVVVMRNADSSFISGDRVRAVLGIPPTSTSFSLDVAKLPDFTVFVQSTSNNRVVLPTTKILYHVDPSAADPVASADALSHLATHPADEPEPSVASPGPATHTRMRLRSSARTKRSDDSAPLLETKKEKEQLKKTPPDSKTPKAKAPKAKAPKPMPKKPMPKKPKPDPIPTPPSPRSKRSARTKRKVPDSDAVSSSSNPAPSAPPTAKTKKALKSKASSSPSAPGGPNASKPTDICFSFDTTGSMYACLSEVRRRLQETILRLRRDLPGLRMAVIAHGDYCDASSSYVIKHCDFTDNVGTLCAFVVGAGSTGGGDADECYELVLRDARTKLSWRDGAQKALVVIGDACPHAPGYPLNVQNIDWRKECDELKERAVSVYAVQAMEWGSAEKFYQELATRTDGFYLRLSQFGSIIDFMLAICYRHFDGSGNGSGGNDDEDGGDGEGRLQAFEDEVRAAGGLNRELHRMFDNLSGRVTDFVPSASAAAAAASGGGGLVPVAPSRFQVLNVDERCSIKDFVTRNDLVFRTGRGFYEFTKPEKIAPSKEVVLVERSTGDMFTGEQAKELIGVAADGEGVFGRIKPAALTEYRVFVQSTSYNRVLLPHTGFLYEVDPDR